MSALSRPWANTNCCVHFISDVQNPDEITAAVFTKRNSSSSLTGLVMVELQDAEFYKISSRATVPNDNFQLIVT